MRHEPRRIEYCNGLARIHLIREHAQLHYLVISGTPTSLRCLSDSSIFSNTSILMDAKLCMDFSSGAAGLPHPLRRFLPCQCCGHAPQRKRRDVAFLHSLPGLTSSPCLFWPRLSANVTRFESRSSVFISFALEPEPKPEDPPS